MQEEGSENEVVLVPEEEEEENNHKEHKNLNHHSLYYDFVQRYFCTYQTPTQYLHQHSNGLFIVRVKTQALPSPPASIRNVLDIQEVKGKKKRGGTKVHKNTVIVEIVCENGFVMPVKALLDGVILERNQLLCPQMLDRPEGYVAVINPGRKFKADPALFQQVILPHQQ